jgi:hypothetical protein
MFKVKSNKQVKFIKPSKPSKPIQSSPPPKPTKKITPEIPQVKSANQFCCLKVCRTSLYASAAATA